MALKRTLKTVEVMDGTDVLGTVHGLSFNTIISLVELNMEAAQSLFNQFAGLDPDGINEKVLMDAGWGMIKTVPTFVAQIIAMGSDAYDDQEAAGDNGEVDALEFIMTLPMGSQYAFLEAIAELTFNASATPKKLLALVSKAVASRGGNDAAL